MKIWADSAYSGAELFDWLYVRFGCILEVKQRDSNVDLIAGNVATGDGAQALIDAGADVNFLNEQGRTPLLIARESANQQAVQILLEAGAKP